MTQASVSKAGNPNQWNSPTAGAAKNKVQKGRHPTHPSPSPPPTHPPLSGYITGYHKTRPRNLDPSGTPKGRILVRLYIFHAPYPPALNSVFEMPEGGKGRGEGGSGRREGGEGMDFLRASLFFLVPYSERKGCPCFD